MRLLILLTILAAACHPKLPTTTTTTTTPSQAKPTEKPKRFAILWTPTDELSEDDNYVECNEDVLGYFFGVPASFTTGLEPLGVVEWRMTPEGELVPHTVNYATTKDGKEMSRAERFGTLNGYPQYSQELEINQWDQTNYLMTTAGVMLVGLPDGSAFGLASVFQVAINRECIRNGGTECGTPVVCYREFLAPGFEF